MLELTILKIRVRSDVCAKSRHLVKYRLCILNIEQGDNIRGTHQTVYGEVEFVTFKFLDADLAPTISTYYTGLDSD